MSDRPILIGAAQITHRVKSIEDFIHPIEFMRRAVVMAAEDAGLGARLSQADALHVVHLLSWNHRDAPTALAEALNFQPPTREYSAIGGNTPQWFVNRIADNLAAGRSRLAILVGCEVMKSVSLAMRAGRDLGFFKDKVQVPLVGITRPGTNQIEQAHFADRPIKIYPIIENALRARLGLSPEEQRHALGRFGETYSAVAAGNPNAWFPVARTAEEIVATSPENRMIAFPYTKYLNAVMAVDMAAALILTTPPTARALGVPSSKWVYLHGGQDAHDAWFVSERPDLAASPALSAIVEDALGQASLALSDIDFFDFYSCFPCMPRLSRLVIGLDEADPRPMTLTGGLPYFGGPGNNYVTHAIAEAVGRCRSAPDAFGMITSNGYYSTKHGVGIYGAREPDRPWSRTPPEEFQRRLALPPNLELDPEPHGEFSVDGYTVWHSRDGDPEVGILCGRSPTGRRVWAQTHREDHDLMEALMKEEWVGRRGRIAAREGAVNIAEFS